MQIPIDKEDSMEKHVKNFLACMRTREKPTLDVETAARAQVLISMAVASYRQGRVLYFDEKDWKVVPKPPKGLKTTQPAQAAFFSFPANRRPPAQSKLTAEWKRASKWRSLRRWPETRKHSGFSWNATAAACSVWPGG